MFPQVFQQIPICHHYEKQQIRKECFLMQLELLERLQFLSFYGFDILDLLNEYMILSFHSKSLERS